MSSKKQIALDLASFLDSAEGKSLASPGREAARKIVEAFLLCSYEGLGKRPELLDGEDLRVLLLDHLTGHMKRRDPLAEHVADVLGAYFDHLERERVVTQSFELRSALLESAPLFARAVALGENVPSATAVRQSTVEHRAAKLGRNDPCFCGSGKKFKKCHGKAS